MQLTLRQSEPECLRQLNEEGPGEEIQGGESIASFQDWVLPAKEIHGLWERYDVIVFWMIVNALQTTSVMSDEKHIILCLLNICLGRSPLSQKLVVFILVQFNFGERLAAAVAAVCNECTLICGQGCQSTSCFLESVLAPKVQAFPP